MYGYDFYSVVKSFRKKVPPEQEGLLEQIDMFIASRGCFSSNGVYSSKNKWNIIK